MTKPKQNLVGLRFGRLVVLEQTEDYIYPNGKHRTQWLCQCDCGNIVPVEQYNLKCGNSKSCGCLNDELRRTRSIKHGDRHSRLYRIWCGIKLRCNNPNGQDYNRYGGRGISVCKEWNESYQAFKDWALASGYVDSPDFTIDRIDVNGNYDPDNCRWANAKQQANNRRSNHWLSYNDETHTVSEWSDITGIPYHTLLARVTKLGWSTERALTTA